MRIALFFVALGLALGGSACVEIDTEATPDLVVATWDPSTGALPTPTDLVRDPEAARLELPIEDGQTAAEQVLRAYLNRLDGYPTSTPIKIPFTGDVAFPGSHEAAADLFGLGLAYRQPTE